MKSQIDDKNKFYNWPKITRPIQKMSCKNVVGANYETRTVFEKYILITSDILSPNSLLRTKIKYELVVHVGTWQNTAVFHSEDGKCIGGTIVFCLCLFFCIVHSWMRINHGVRTRGSCKTRLRDLIRMMECYSGALIRSLWHFDVTPLWIVILSWGSLYAKISYFLYDVLYSLFIVFNPYCTFINIFLNVSCPTKFYLRF